jgi:hypothetical protein
VRHTLWLVCCLAHRPLPRALLSDEHPRGLCTTHAATYSPDTTWRPRAAMLGTSPLVVNLARLSGLSPGCAP